MKVVKYFRELAEYNNWADSVIWKSVLANTKSKENEKIKSLLFHLHETQRAFYYLWIQEPLDLSKLGKILSDVNEIAQMGEYVDAGALKFVRELKSERLEEIIKIPWDVYMEKYLGKKPGAATLADTILQAINHSVYHRAQVNKALREMDVDPPMLDYIAWVWLEKPEADWSSVRSNK